MNAFLIWTRQNNVEMFGIIMLPLTKRQTDRQILNTQNRKQKWLLAFKKPNQNTQEVKNESVFNMDKTKQCANFRHSYVAFKNATDKQIWNTKHRRQRWLLALKTKQIKTHKRLKMTLFFLIMDKIKQCGNVRHNNVAFNKATDRQTDLKHKTYKTKMTAGVQNPKSKHTRG